MGDSWAVKDHLHSKWLEEGPWEGAEEFFSLHTLIDIEIDIEIGIGIGIGIGIAIGIETTWR